MGPIPFLALQRFILFLRALAFPLLAWGLPLLWPWARDRRRFEKANATDPLSRPFSSEGLRAHVAFEVASEGELEQVRPLLDWFLHRKNRVELIYCSESVAAKCQDLGARHAPLLRLFRLPLLSYFPWPWPWPLLLGETFSLPRFISAPKLILCRYDFYPELLLWGARPQVHFILVSASLKSGKREFYKKGLYRLFDVVVCATPEERENFLTLGLSLPTDRLLAFDFRPVRIKQRLQQAPETLAKFSFYAPYKCYLEETFPRERRLIIGSAWPEEMDILEDPLLTEELKKGQWHVLIAPHRRGPSFLKALAQRVRGHTRGLLPLYTLERGQSHQDISALIREMEECPGIFMITIPGILCELYSLFGQALVGGGHGRSVHSLLEPYFAKAKVYCGPKVQRSTEYDFIVKRAPQSLEVVEQLKEFAGRLRREGVRPTGRGEGEIEQVEVFEKLMERLEKR